MKDVFDSYIFEFNKIKVENQSTLKEREFLISLISFGLAFLFYILEIESAIIFFMIIGCISGVKYRIPKLKKAPNLGIGTDNLQIHKDYIRVNEKFFQFQELDKVLFKLRSHEGQLVNDMNPSYLFSNGKNNEIVITNNGKKISFNFCLFNYPHYAKLIQILEDSNVEIDDRVV